MQFLSYSFTHWSVTSPFIWTLRRQEWSFKIWLFCTRKHYLVADRWVTGAIENNYDLCSPCSRWSLAGCVISLASPRYMMKNNQKFYRRIALKKEQTASESKHKARAGVMISWIVCNWIQLTMQLQSHYSKLAWNIAEMWKRCVYRVLHWDRKAKMTDREHVQELIFRSGCCWGNNRVLWGSQSC